MTTPDTREGTVEIGYVDNLVITILSEVFPHMRDVALKVALLTDGDKESIAMAGWTDFVSGRGRHFSNASIDSTQKEEIIEIWDNCIKNPIST